MSTIYEILEDYPIVNNRSELLNSDILILPNKKKEGLFVKAQPFGLGNLNKDLKIKCYCDGEPSIRYEASTVIDLGIIVLTVVNFVASIVTLSEYIRKFHETDSPEITIVHGDLYNNCQINEFNKGNGSEVSKNILILKDNYK